MNRNRPKITPQTSPADLFGILKAMIQPFGDAHTFLGASRPHLEFHGIRPGTDRVLTELAGPGGFHAFRKGGMPKLMAVTDTAYLQGPPRQYCNGQLQFGHIDATTGYLRILAFSGYTKRGGFAEGSVALEAALDEIFPSAALQALVIDVRINFGGDDPYGISIASRLAPTEYLAYTKYARADAVHRDQWTPGDPSMVQPSSRPGFHGPVVELTGPLTISAGETFTQALMGRVPHVTRIGENSQGVFSDVLVRRLPNGWVFGLPNEVYRTAEGHAFGGPGIPPDIAVPVFAAADVAAGKDPAIARALEILRGGGG
ncbi:MAG: S41 family peptidase [Bryobacteraceae bacterium]